jgi:hypothetical protein
MKGLWIHTGVLGVALVLGIYVATSEETETPEATSETYEVWGGSPDSVQMITFEAPKRTVVLEPKKDSEGRYYVAKVDKVEGAAPPPPKNPHAPAPEPAPNVSGPEKRTTVRFIGVKAADEAAKRLAPLLAIRRIGPVEAKRNEEFGLDKPDGTLKVKIGGTEHTLVIGGTTPGGQERYAREPKSGAVYAVNGDIAQDLLSAESKLLERNLHGFEDTDVTRVRVSKRDKSREIAAMPDKKGSWADSATPTKLDETAGNWMTKVERLHVQDYVETPAAPLRKEDAVVRVEYFSGGRQLGFLELYKVPGEKGSEYLVKSERTRWAAKVLTSAAEQVDQDLGSVLK